MTRTRTARMKRAMGQAADAPVRPTPQTAARLRHDVIARLLVAGRLLPVHARAAEDIRIVCEAVGRGMFPTAQPFSAAGRAPRRAGPRDFLDRMSGRERHLWQRRYLPWTRALAVEIATPMAGTSWLQLVVDVVVDNATLREVEARYRLRHGSALDYLRRGLDAYDARPDRADRAPDAGDGAGR